VRQGRTALLSAPRPPGTTRSLDRGPLLAIDGAEDDKNRVSDRRGPCASTTSPGSATDPWRGRARHVGVGALAVGRLVIANAVIRRLRAEELEIGSLKVGELEVAGQRWPGPTTPPAA